MKPARYKSADFLYDEDSKEVICGNCFKRMNDSDVMRRVGSIWFCQELRKTCKPDRTRTQGGYRKSMTVVIICMIVLFLLVFALFLSIGRLSEEVTKVKSANSLLTLLTLAAAENKVKKSGGSEDISELIKIILQNEENSDRN